MSKFKINNGKEKFLIQLLCIWVGLWAVTDIFAASTVNIPIPTINSEGRVTVIPTIAPVFNDNIKSYTI